MDYDDQPAVADQYENFDAMQKQDEQKEAKRKSLIDQIRVALDGGWVGSGHRKVVRDIDAKEADKGAGELTAADKDKRAMSQAKINVLLACQLVLESKGAEHAAFYGVIAREENNKELPSGQLHDKPLYQVNTASLRGSRFWQAKAGQTFSETYEIYQQTTVCLGLNSVAATTGGFDAAVDRGTGDGLETRLLGF